jgi:hypothetical protein
MGANASYVILCIHAYFMDFRIYGAHCRHCQRQEYWSQEKMAHVLTMRPSRSEANYRSVVAEDYGAEAKHFFIER